MPKRVLPGEINISSVSGGVNKHIVIATLGLVAIGIIKHSNDKNAKLSPILMGGFVFMLVLSLIDLIGGDASKVAGGLAMLALVSGLVSDVPWNSILGSVPAASTPPPRGSSPGGTGHTP